MVTRTPLLPDDQRRRVEDAIADAERRTSAEFVVVIARRSGRYDRSEDLFGLVLSFAALIAVSVLWPSPVPPGSWDASIRIPLGLPVTLLLIAAVYALGAALATRFPVISRPFRTRAEMTTEVRRRAADCFADFRVHAHAQGRGVLLYVSLLERIVWITADDAVREKTDPRLWEQLRDDIVGGIHAGDLASGIIEGLRRAAASLVETLPPAPEPANRLPNTVHEL